MAISSLNATAYAFGILGNIVSFMVYLAPVPTFHRILKKKSTEEFQAIPYAVALFSAMLYLYYAFLKGNIVLLITINSVGAIMETGYLILFMIYATKESRVFTAKLLVVFNVLLLGVIVSATFILSHGESRTRIVGWICAAFSVGVFAAPLGIIRQVMETKSVEYMPISLSLFLTICSVVWFFYGFLISDFYIATPNILGFAFGVVQMGLYFMYKNKKGKLQHIIQPSSNENCETKVHDIVIELKSLDQKHHNGSFDPRDLEIVVVEV